MKIKGVIIGTGWVARNRHIPALTKYGCELDFFDVLNENPLSNAYDFAVICTPPHKRLPATQLALELNVKKIFFEKPFATKIAEAMEIKAALENTQVEVYSCHNFLFSNTGEFIKSNPAINSAQFYQLNRVDRQLPSWIGEIPHGIALDEFAHFGYLARALFPTSGLNSPRVNLIENASSTTNLWRIQYETLHGFVECDLWRDAVYYINGQPQKSYWQYKSELVEGAGRIKSALKRLGQRVVLRRSNDFGTSAMWKKFLNNTLTERERDLTSLDLSIDILKDFYKTRNK